MHGIKILNKKTLTIVTIISFSIVKYAYSVPNAGSLLNFEEEIKKVNILPVQVPDENELINGVSGLNGEKIEVKGFQFDGQTNGFTNEQLTNVIKDLIGKSLSFDDIQNAAKRIQNFYRNEGYFLAQAFIPEQEVKKGIVIIYISEGKLDSKEPFEIKNNNLRLKEGVPESYFIEGMKGKFTQEGLERSILNFNEIPGVEGKVTLKPGKDSYSTSIIIEAKEGPLLTGNIVLDNYGNRYTGQNRATGSAFINNPTKIGDQITFNMIAAPTGNFNLNKLGYNFPVGRDGMRGAISLNQLEYKIGKDLKTSPMSKGDAFTYTANIKYPLLRSAIRTLLISGDYNYKDMYNETTGVETSDKTIENYSTSFLFQNIDEILLGGYMQALFTQSFGELDLSGASSDLTSDQSSSGAKTDGSFSKSYIQFMRIQRIAERLDLQILGSMQLASQNLDSSEKFTLGGIGGVRAYPSGEASGDEGRKVSFDLKYKPGGSPINLFNEMQFGVFYDYGNIKQYKDLLNISMTTPNKYSLKGWGASLDMFSGNNFSLKLGVADSVSGNPAKTSSGNNSDGKDNTWRYWFLGVFNLK